MKKSYILLGSALCFCIGNAFAQSASKYAAERVIPGAMNRIIEPQNASTQQSTAPAKKHINKSGATSIPIGKSANIYSIILNGQNQVSYNPDINTVTFTHRQDPNNPGGGGSGVLTYDISTDGGTTWSLEQGPLTPNLKAGTAPAYVGGCRYPSGTLWNPTGNTDPNNAYIVGAAPTIITGESWGLLSASSLQLNGTNPNEQYYTNTGTDSIDFHPYGLCNVNGTLFSISTTINKTTNAALDTNTYKTFYINKGVYNSTTHSFDWSVVKSFTPDVYRYTYQGNLENFTEDWNIAFGPDGMTGYAVVLCAEQNVSLDTVPRPLVYKTTDGGNSWSKLPAFDFSTLATMQAYTQPTNVGGDVRPYFSSFDATVDSTNTLHLFSFMYSGFSADPDSLTYIFAATQYQSLMDVYYNPTTSTWGAIHVDTIATGRGTIGNSPDTLSVYYSPQASRTANGNRVFFTWSMTDPINSATNNIPDVYGVMFNVKTQTLYPIKKFTNVLGAFFPTASPIAITGGDDFEYEIPIVYASPNATAPTLGIPQYYYLKGAGFNDSGYTPPPAGITKLAQKNNISIFPNPSNGQVTIQLKSADNAQINIYNIVGEQVRSIKVHSTSNTIDLSALSKGIYFVKVVQDKNTTTTKLVLMK